MSIQTTDRPAVGEFNGLVDGLAYHRERQQDHGGTVPWDTKGLEITRLRLLSDPGYPLWDVSYCHGMLNGQHVDVQLPFSELPKRNMRRALYAEAKKTGVFIKGLFSAISTLN
jgi:hypothetical protein